MSNPVSPAKKRLIDFRSIKLMPKLEVKRVGHVLGSAIELTRGGRARAKNSGAARSNALSLDVWYVRWRPRDFLAEFIHDRVRPFRLAHVSSLASALRVGRQSPLSFEIVREDGSRFAVGGIMLP